MVIDASIGVKWLVPEDDADQARALLLKGPLFVPRLFLSEIANALWKKARLAEIDLAAVNPVSSVGEVVLFVDDADHAARAIEIGCELDHPVYDCLYLAAAEALDVQLVTADSRFRNKVKATAHARRVVTLADLGLST